MLLGRLFCKLFDHPPYSHAGWIFTKESHTCPRCQRVGPHKAEYGFTAPHELIERCPCGWVKRT